VEELLSRPVLFDAVETHGDAVQITEVRTKLHCGVAVNAEV